MLGPALQSTSQFRQPLLTGMKGKLAAKQKGAIAKSHYQPKLAAGQKQLLARSCCQQKLLKKFELLVPR